MEPGVQLFDGNDGCKLDARSPLLAQDTAEFAEATAMAYVFHGPADVYRIDGSRKDDDPPARAQKNSRPKAKERTHRA